MKFYAHTKSDSNGELLDPLEWEPLFSDDCGNLHGGACEKCYNLDPKHGHLNKVAWLAGKFAGEMFPAGPYGETARRKKRGVFPDLGLIWASPCPNG